MRRLRGLGAIAIGLLVLGGGCREDEYEEELEDRRVREYAEAYCAMMFSCDCTRTVFSSEDACLHHTFGRFRARQLQARGSGWVYDDACLRARIEAVEQTACEQPLPSEESCSYYHGDRQEGDACIWISAGMTDCSSELRCRFGVCYAPDDPDPSFYLEEGEKCLEESAEGRYPLGACAPGHHCHIETHACIPTPELGDPCEGLMLCEEGHCEADVCVPDKVAGDPCTHWSQCERGLNCVEDVCAELDPSICGDLFP
jgi:hypothetical protein